MKEKSDAFKATEQFLSDIAHCKVKTLNFHEDVFPAGDVKRMRSDNGGEYLAGNFKELPASHHHILLIKISTPSATGAHRLKWPDA